MQIILLEGMNKLGNAGEIVNVKSGYARNFLIPQKKAIIANKKNKEDLQSKMNQINANNEKKINEAKSIKNQLEGFKLRLEMEANEDGALYGTINPKHIIQEINQSFTFNLVTDNLILGSIKSTGIHSLDLRLYDNLMAKIELEVIKKN